MRSGGRNCDIVKNALTASSAARAELDLGVLALKNAVHSDGWISNKTNRRTGSGSIQGLKWNPMEDIGAKDAERSFALIAIFQGAARSPGLRRLGRLGAPTTTSGGFQQPVRRRDAEARIAGCRRS
jgi:hypothetical protein